MAKRMINNPTGHHASIMSDFWQRIANITREFLGEDEIVNEYVEAEFSELIARLDEMSSGVMDTDDGSLTFEIQGKRFEMKFTTRVTDVPDNE